jgi:hypothetical protein
VIWEALAEHKRKQCGHKKRFDDPKEARRAAYPHIKPGTFMSVYKCLYCRKWHIGHKRFARNTDGSPKQQWMEVVT